MTDETSTTGVWTDEDFGKALVSYAKRLEGIGLVYQLPKERLAEALEDLIAIYKFHTERP